MTRILGHLCQCYCCFSFSFSFWPLQLNVSFSIWLHLFLLPCQNTNSASGQIRYLVYCMENAILSLNSDQEQMVWLIDFQGWKTSSISIKVTRETAHILQDFYPERLGLGILYNPPKVFESFWTVCHDVPPFFLSFQLLLSCRS